MGIARPVAKHAERTHAEVLRVARVVHSDAVPHPLQELLLRHAAEVLFEFSAARRQAFVGNTAHSIHQDLHRHVAEVLLRETGKDFGGTFAAHLLAKRRNGPPVGSRQGLVAVGSGIGAERLLHIGRTDAVLSGKTLAVRPQRLRADVRLVVLAERRNQVEVERGAVRAVLVEADADKVVLADAHLAEAEASVLAGPHDEVALAAGQGGLPLGIALLRDKGIELRVVVQTVVDRGVLHRQTVGAEHRYLDRGDVSIVLRDVNLRVAGIAAHHFLRSVVAAEHLRVHQHATGSRLVEPAEVEHRLGLAGSEEVPPAVHPGLHPGMIVVGVRPARCVHLAGRDADGAECRDGEGALLAATPDGGTQRVHRRRGAAVAGLVADVLVAPVVDLEHSAVHRLALHALLQLVVVDDAEGVEVLVVDTQGQDEVPPLPAGDLRAPGHLAPGLQGDLDISLPEPARVVHAVGQRHVGVQEVQRLLLLAAAAGAGCHKNKEPHNEGSLQYRLLLTLHTCLR